LTELLPCVAEQALVDHHCHGVLVRDADQATLESMLTEGGGWPGGSVFDSGAGFAFRRLCPPVLGLAPHAELSDYVARRSELGAAEVSRRFLSLAGVSVLCVDTGFIPETPEPLTSPAELGALAGGCAHEIVRLERVAEEVAAAGVSAAGFADAVRSALAARTVVGTKSIAAYRTGLDLHRCNPLLLTPLLRAIQPTGVPVMLLHNYPYHREAGYLAQVFPHVCVDAGLATHNLGARAPALLAEALELAPYGKFLYSSDAFGLPELYYLGAALFRQALSEFLRTGLDDDLYSERTVVRLTRMLCAGNASRAYQLGP